MNPDDDIGIFFKFTDKDIRNLCVNHKVQFLKIQPTIEEQRDKIINALDEEIQKRKMGIGPRDD